MNAKREAMRRAAVVLLGSLLLSSGCVSGGEPAYPEKPINFYIPAAAGGANDLGCRALVAAAAKHLGQQFTPINRGGAGGSMAATAIINAKPDGYTLGMMATSNTFVVPFSDEAPYRDLSGFTWIINYTNNIWPAFVRTDAPWQTWQEFIAWAKKNPRGVKIGLNGGRSNSINGLMLWQIEKREKVEFSYIPLKGGADILPAVLGGHITMSASAADATVVEYLKQGKIGILLFLSNDVIPGYEKVPGIKSLYGIESPNVSAIVGPRGLPKHILAKLEDAFARAVKDPDFIAVMHRMHLGVNYMNSTQVQDYVTGMFQKAGEAMKSVKAEEAQSNK
jgi:tripartite-type tricarboxylate transporter receptor subunit TctC